MAADARPVVLLVGATGFIGRHIWTALEAAGFGVRPAARSGDDPRLVRVDFERDTTPEAWLPHVRGASVVINAAGAFAGKLDAVHATGPVALFDAARQAGVGRVLQISSLGADSAATAYFATKGEADRFVATLGVPAAILRPSLVFGTDGRSSALMMMLATLPLIPAPREFDQRVQPVHVEDLVQAVVLLARSAPLPAQPLAVVGSTPLTMRTYLAALRSQLGLGKARFLPLPAWVMRVAGHLLPRAFGGLLQPDALRMLAAGSTADPAPLAALLGRPPRGADAFIRSHEARAAAHAAALAWLVPLLRCLIAALWIWSGVVSLGLYPVEDSHALLAATPMPEGLRHAALVGAALLDIVLGIAVFWLYRQRWVWHLQMLVIVAYTVAITLWLPAFWLHPYAPVAKNVPLLAMLFLLRRLEAR